MGREEPKVRTLGRGTRKCRSGCKESRGKWDLHASPDSEEGESDLFRLTETQGWKRCAGKKLGWLGRVVRTR